MAVSKIRYTSLLLHLPWLLMSHALLCAQLQCMPGPCVMATIGKQALQSNANATSGDVTYMFWHQGLCVCMHSVQCSSVYFHCFAACLVQHSSVLMSHLSEQRPLHHRHTWSQRHDSFTRCAVHGFHLLRCCVQVDEAYLQFGPAHDIVGFMQSLGYKDFRTARQGEEKMEQFKRALKLTRPAFAATRSPMQQVINLHKGCHVGCCGCCC